MTKRKASKLFILEAENLGSCKKKENGLEEAYKKDFFFPLRFPTQLFFKSHTNAFYGDPFCVGNIPVRVKDNGARSKRHVLKSSMLA